MKFTLKVLTLLGGSILTYRASERTLEYLVEEKEATIVEVLLAGLAIGGIGVWASIAAGSAITDGVEAVSLLSK